MNTIKFNYKTSFNTDFSLNLFTPVLFLKEQPGVFKKTHFTIEEKLKLFQLDADGALYSVIKFSPLFLKKLDLAGIGYFAFKYAIKDKPIQYAIVLKSMRRFNPKYIVLK